MMRCGTILGGLAAAAAMLTSRSSEVVGCNSVAPEPMVNTPRKRGKNRHRLGRTGRYGVKPNSNSVKSWARFLARNVTGAVRVRNPEKYMHAAARRRAHA